MVDAPDDVERMVERLSVPGTWARHKDNLVASSAAETLVRDDAPFEAANLIQSLSSQITKIQAERDEFRTCLATTSGKLMAAEAERDRLLERLQISPQGDDAIDAAESAAEFIRAERDRLAAENEALRRELKDIADSDDIDNALDPNRNKRVARAALTAAKAGEDGR